MPKLQSPIRSRYTSKEMQELFPEDPEFFSDCSDEMIGLLSKPYKVLGWCDCWYVLGANQKILDIPIPTEHLEAIKKAIGQVDMARADEIERQIKHEPNNYVRHLAELANAICPGAGSWVNNGATSEFALGNQDRRTQKAALELLIGNLVMTDDPIDLTDSLITRRTLDFIRDEWHHRLDNFPTRGAKGTTGTQDSYLTMFDGDAEKVFKLDELVAQDLGFDSTFTITGQTNPRVTDVQLLFDLRLISDFCNGKEVNPKAEKALQFSSTAAVTMAGAQMLERSLDDSTERRVLLTEPFAAADVILKDLESYMIEDYSPVISRDYLSHQPSQNLERYHFGLENIKEKTVNLIKFLSHYSEQYKDTPCLGSTHLQPAQPTTVGKRIALWNYNFVLAFKDLEHVLSTDFEGIDEKIVENRMTSVLCQIAAAASKMALDVRIMQKDFEVSEPYSKEQTGSAAMPHKKNPMLSERINGFARKLVNYANQERMNHVFLYAEAILKTANTIFTDQPPEGKTPFQAYGPMVYANLMRHLPFLASEKVLTAGVKKGLDRTQLYEKIRTCATLALENFRSGNPNNMLELMEEHGINLDNPGTEYLKKAKNYIGLAPQQVDRFHKIEVQPILTKYNHLLREQEQTQI
ncbi:MAG: hypothetical protein KAT77_06370 [Nanoarchaeota archaeon]|nr:hypothetical protein [Nanoarchaeota archaeon]